MVRMLERESGLVEVVGEENPQRLKDLIGAPDEKKPFDYKVRNLFAMIENGRYTVFRPGESVEPHEALDILNAIERGSILRDPREICNLYRKLDSAGRINYRGTASGV